MDRTDGELRSRDFNDLDRLEPYVCCHSDVHESMLLSDDIRLENPGKAPQELIGKSCPHLGQGIISVRSRIEGRKKQRSIASRPVAFAADSADHDQIEGIGQLFLILSFELDPQPAPLAGLIGAGCRLDHHAFGAIPKSLAKVARNAGNVRAYGAV